MTRTVPFKHQVEDTQKLIENDSFALFSEMGTGKSRIVIDAACTLSEQGKIDTVVVVCPASVRCVWLDSEIGEIKKHASRVSIVLEFHVKLKKIWEDGSGEKDAIPLTWLITNYEFLRSEDRLAELCALLLKRNVLLVLDESSYIKNRTAQQTRAVAKLRKHCARCVLLNGTPITKSPLDLWSQMQVLSPEILKSFHNFYNFRAEYCVLRAMRFGGSRSFQQIISYRRLDCLAKKLAPYVIRREKRDCLDLPPKLYTVREVALSAASWKRYRELKKDALLTLSESEVRMEPNAAVRVMRLAQLTSGILGIGVTNLNDVDCVQTTTQDISDEKLRWAVKYLTEECQARAVIVWCRWRRERERLFEEIGKYPGKYPGITRFQLYGGQKQSERDEAVAYFSHSNNLSDKFRYILIAQQHAGGFGLNLVAATEAIYLSNDFSLGIRLQSEDRCHRMGQEHAVTYLDVLATGPKGERTIDHAILKALREKLDVATMTYAWWRKELKDEN